MDLPVYVLGLGRDFYRPITRSDWRTGRLLVSLYPCLYS